MQPSKIRGSGASFQPLAHPAVKLVFEVAVLLALWAGLWLVVWGGVLHPLARATAAYGGEGTGVQAETVR